MKIFRMMLHRLFPSERQLIVKKWYTDGGDYKLRFNYNLNNESIVLDIGGYQGQWASDLFSRYKCHIIIFEPVREFAEQIQKRFLKNDSIEVFNYGLGGSNRLEYIHLSASGSSLFGTSINCEEIKIKDIKEWINEKGLRKISLIKINIEGGEYELLERLIETDLIKNIENIQVQFHNVTKNSKLRMKKIQIELQRTHIPIYQYEFVWENWRRIE